MGRVGDFDPLVGGDDDEGGGVGCAEAESEVAVGLDLGGAVAGGVDDEGHLLVVGLEPFAGKALEIVLAGDEGLAGEYVAAIVFSDHRQTRYRSGASSNAGFQSLHATHSETLCH